MRFLLSVCGPFLIALLLLPTNVHAQQVTACAVAAYAPAEYFDRGRACYELGQYERAIEDFSRGLEQTPNDIGALTWRAHIYRTIGAFALAISDYDHILALDASSAVTYRSRGNSRYQLQHTEQALADLNRALALDPGFAAAYADRALIARDQGDIDGALVDLTNAIQTYYEPLDWAYHQRGLLYVSQQQYEAALVDFSQAVALVPESGFYHNWRGYALHELGNMQAALAEFNQAIALNDSDAWAYASRGQAYQLLGNTDQALLDLHRALTLDPDNRDALVYRGATFAAAGHYELAQADYEHALQLDPNYAEGYRGLGEVYDLQGNGERALANYYRYRLLTGGQADPQVSARVQTLEQQQALKAFLLSLVGIFAVVLGYRVLRRQMAETLRAVRPLRADSQPQA